MLDPFTPPNPLVIMRRTLRHQDCRRAGFGAPPQPTNGSIFGPSRDRHCIRTATLQCIFDTFRNLLRGHRSRISTGKQCDSRIFRGAFDRRPGILLCFGGDLDAGDIAMARRCFQSRAMIRTEAMKNDSDSHFERSSTPAPGAALATDNRLSL